MLEQKNVMNISLDLNSAQEFPIVSIIIANWNGRSWLETCLPAIEQQTWQDYEIIIVDNGSQDDSVSWLRENWPEVIVIPLKLNLGFAAANNMGIRAAQGTYIVTLNNDTLVDEMWLAEMITAVSAPDIGMVAAKITIWNQPEILDSTGIEIDKLGTAWNRGYGQSSENDYGTEVLGPSAAAALYRRDMLEEIGLFDENYFAYYEDVDLAWRGRRAGWRCVYAQNAHVRHWHSATGEKTPRLKTFLIGRNKVWSFIKNYSKSKIFLILPFFILYDGLAAVVQTIYLRHPAPLNGRLQAWLTIRYIWSQRTPGESDVALIPLTKPWQLTVRVKA